MLKNLFVVYVGTLDFPASPEEVKEVEAKVLSCVRDCDIPVVLPFPCSVSMFQPRFTEDGKETRLIHAKVGCPDWMVSEEDVECVKVKLEKAIEDNGLSITVLATRFNVEIDAFPPMECP
jgi:hypothetical protein